MKGKVYMIPVFLHETAGIDTLSPAISKVITQDMHIVAEDIRSTRRFISKLKIGINIELLHITTLDKDTSLQDLYAVQQHLLSGGTAGVFSEAGCPGIADPGNILVKWAHQNQISVIPLVGPSSILLTLMASGLNGQQFTFHGYLPIDPLKRKSKISELEKQSKSTGYAHIFIETPYRNTALYQDLLLILPSDTLLCIGVDLTSPDGFVQTRKIIDWKPLNPDLHKKNVLFIIQSGS